MSDRCAMCGEDFKPLHPCHLVYDPADDPADWIEVTVCLACWRAAAKRHATRLLARERKLLADWERRAREVTA